MVVNLIGTDNRIFYPSMKSAFQKLLEIYQKLKVCTYPTMLSFKCSQAGLSMFCRLFRVLVKVRTLLLHTYITCNVIVVPVSDEYFPLILDYLDQVVELQIMLLFWQCFLCKSWS